MPSQLSWGRRGLQLQLEWSDDAPLRLTGLTLGSRSLELGHSVAMVEVLAAHAGRTPASDRLAHTTIGESMRYVGHEVARDGADEVLVLLSESVEYGVAARQELRIADAADAIRSSVTIRNIGATPLVLQAVTSWSAAIGSASGADPVGDWRLTSGGSDWLGEGQWHERSLRSAFPRLAEHLTGHNPRGSYSTVSTGTWSTGKHLPVAVVDSRELGLAVAWQIDHNGAWRWELGEDTPGVYLALSGPTEIDSAWTKVVEPEDSFETIGVTVALAADFDGVVEQLTAARRAARRDHQDNAAMSVVFNDYMNTLNGDPTTAKLLPLIEAAAEVGAEIFCIDAGWYDDSGHWWDSVGEWLPSTTRFPGGLSEVVDAIRAAGMVPGLWLEPEVVGVRSSVAQSLPLEAFVLRRGVRVVEHGRYHLDLRHPAVIDHLDSVIDRLVADFGVGFLKLDYNINPGAGTDHNSDSLGDGLLGMNRAHLAWLDGVLDRHPTLVIENCASGAMRMDSALMSRLAMQSTSDQQDYLRFPPIAASAPLSLLPEQAANWAYPQPGMTAEQVAFCLATGLLGRFYLSGYLNRMDAAERALVAEAVAVAKSLRPEIASGTPRWPGGLPEWDGDWISLALGGEKSNLVTIWNRSGQRTTTLHFPHYVGRDLTVSTVFPLSLDQWTTHWEPETGTLTVHAATTQAAARTIRLTPVGT